MTPAEAEVLTERIVDQARKVHSGEVTFAGFACFVRDEIRLLLPASEMAQHFEAAKKLYVKNSGGRQT